MPTLASGPNTLGVLQAMQSIILSEALVAGVSPFAALSAADQARYGVTRAVFIGRPKDFSDAYLPQCALWIPQRDEGQQPVELIGHVGRVFDDIEVTIQAFVDMRSDWWVAEQKILQIRDALWPVVLKHVLLGGAVSTVTDADAYEGLGLCYEEIAGIQYRSYQLIWQITQQYSIAGGVAQ